MGATLVHFDLAPVVARSETVLSLTRRPNPKP